MSVLLALDPGIRGCGVAVFDGKELVEALYIMNPCREGCGAAEASSMASWVYGSIEPCFGINALAVEWPRVYASRIRAGVSKGDPNDLLALAAVDAALVALFGVPATSYAPSDWKGQMPKDVCEARVRSRLSPTEVALVEAVGPASKRHNTWDAVGIGLHHLDQLAKRRVIP